MPPSIVKFVRENTASFGKVKLVLKQNRYYVESAYPDTLQLLLKDEVIQQAVIRSDAANAAIEIAPAPEKPAKPAAKEGEAETIEETVDEIKAELPDDLYNVVINLDKDETDDAEDRVYSFEINPKQVEVCSESLSVCMCT